MAKRRINLDVWRDKYGTEILIKKMGDFHLLRAIRCYERYAADRERRLRSRLSAVVNSKNTSSQARKLAEKQFVVLGVEGYSISKVFPKYPKLCEEAVIRNLL